MRWGKFLIRGGIACGICLLIVLFRLREHSLLLALSDGFSVSGFFALVVAFAPLLLRSEALDGFSYAGRFTLFGFFPWRTESFPAYKKHREEGRKQRFVSRDWVYIGIAFLLLGLFFSFLFL